MNDYYNVIAERIVREVVDELYRRKGFDSWWVLLDDDAQDDITDALADKVVATITKYAR
jgi:hypothetical protein